MLDLTHNRDYFRSLFARLGIDPLIRYRTLSFELVSVLNLRPAEGLTYDGSRLVSLTITDPVESLTIGLARIRGARLSRRAMAFTEYCRAHVPRGVAAAQ